jgi:integrase
VARMPRIWFRAARGSYFATLGGRQVNLGTTLEAARIALDALLASDGRFYHPTLESAVAGFLEALVGFVAIGDRSPVTLRQRQSQLRHLPPDMVRRPLASITPREVEAWAMGRGGSPRTRAARVEAVKLAAKWADPECPLARMPIRRPRSPRRRLMTEAESRAWLARMPAELRAIAEFLRDTGCRPGEARRIEARHVDGCFAVLAEHKTARETGEARLIPLPPSWQDRLATMVNERPTGPLFRNHDGGPWGDQALCQAFKRAARRAGLPDHVTAYPLRHAWITQRLIDGVPVATVAALAGHASAKMTLDVYSHVHLRRDHLAEVVRRIG